MLNKQYIIHAICENTKVQLRPSMVCSGVGVFAIEPIKRGTIIFPDIEKDDILITWEEINTSEQVKKYLSKICNSDSQGIYLSRTPNNINIAYYINHSINPNVFHDRNKDSYIAIRDIKRDEELLCLYTFNEIDW
jgi:hypothetical protein